MYHPALNGILLLFCLWVTMGVSSPKKKRKKTVMFLALISCCIDACFADADFYSLAHSPKPKYTKFSQLFMAHLYNCVCPWSQSVILCYWLVRHFIDVQFFLRLLLPHVCTWHTCIAVLTIPHIVGASIVLYFAYSSRINKAQWVHTVYPCEAHMYLHLHMHVNGILHMYLLASKWLCVFGQLLLPLFF